MEGCKTRYFLVVIVKCSYDDPDYAPVPSDLLETSVQALLDCFLRNYYTHVTDDKLDMKDVKSPKRIVRRPV